ncbi:uncharacterized protein [Panulirus ornatus]
MHLKFALTITLGLLAVCHALPLGLLPAALAVVPNAIGLVNAGVAATGLTLIKVAIYLGFAVNYKTLLEEAYKEKGYKIADEPHYTAPSAPYGPPAQRYHKRSTTQETWGEEVVELEKLLVSAASRLDTDGCVLKLLCHLNNKQAHARTLEENVLLQLFSNNPDTLSFYHATFDNTAADVSKTQEQVATSACDKVFSSCTLGQEELSSLLQQTWPCPNITP